MYYNGWFVQFIIAGEFEESSSIDVMTTWYYNREEKHYKWIKQMINISSTKPEYLCTDTNIYPNLP